MKLRITAVCNVGGVRDNNEDMVLVGQKLFRDSRVQGAIALGPEAPPYLVAVADGMGGANAGEIASEMVLDGLREGLSRLPGNLGDDALRAVIRAVCEGIHQQVIGAGNAEPERKGMGATLVGLLHYDGRLVYLAAGDSRLYRFRDGTLMQVSKDHSLRDLSAVPEIPQNIILNSFGGGRAFYIDVGPATRQVLNDDLFLLCSDGISDVLSDEEIERVLRRADRGDLLLATAIESGSQDNVSYVLVEISEIEYSQLVSEEHDNE